MLIAAVALVAALCGLMYTAVLVGPGTATKAIWVASGDPAIRLLLVYPDRPATTEGTPHAQALPVVFFNPGWRVSLEGYQEHLRILAAAGYVVIGVERSAASMTAQGGLDLSSASAFAATLARADTAVRAHASQMSRLLDALGALHLQGVRLDPDRVGIFGHSFGGAVAMQTCLVDKRFRAAVNIDGWQFGDAVTRPVMQPWMVITDRVGAQTGAEPHASDPASSFADSLSQRDGDWIRAQSARPDVTIVEIDGAPHGAFIRQEGWRSLASLWLDRLGIRPDAASITDRALKNFFSQHLAGETMPRRQAY